MTEEQAESCLSQVSGDPSILKNADLKTIEKLAKEIRRRIIETVAVNGGHLAPSLGVVELSLALLASFHFPHDEVIWDVGHQCYPWKLLTGREDRFSTIRTRNGIAGFPKREESEYDTFDTGHSATSISAALGKLVASSLKGESKNIIAVIGDGALTGGLALEGLNDAGRLAGKQKGRLIVVLNDNEMSINENVGAFSSYLNSIRTEPFYRDSRDYARDLIKGMPRVGGRLYSILSKLEGSLKYLVVPGVLFEELGFTYLGPVDGHNVSMLIEELGHASHLNNKPVLLHVKTVKGKGYEPAENNQSSFHGTGPFDKSNGKRVSKDGPQTYTEAFGKAIVKIADEDNRICAVSAAMTSGTGLTSFSEKYPGRFFDVGIAEQHAVTFSAGIATEGLKPVVAIYSTFMQRAVDQVLHDVALQNLPVVFALDRAGLVGEDGPTHHGVFDISLFRSIPNMVMASPANECEIYPMLKALIDSDGPAMIRYPRGSGTGVPLLDGDDSIEIGKSRVLVKGQDCTVIAIGSMVSVALKAAEFAEKRGVSVTVIDGRFIKPLDSELFLSIGARGKPVITIEENMRAGGFGSSILELFEENNLRPELHRMGIPDTFVCHGSVASLRQDVGLTSEALCEQICRCMDLECKESAAAIAATC